MNLGYILLKEENNCKIHLSCENSTSLVTGCILSKYPDGRRFQLTLKGMVGYILHLPEMSFCVCAHHSSVRLNGLPLMNTKGHMHT